MAGEGRMGIDSPRMADASIASQGTLLLQFLCLRLFARPPSWRLFINASSSNFYAQFDAAAFRHELITLRLYLARLLPSLSSSSPT